MFSLIVEWMHNTKNLTALFAATIGLVSQPGRTMTDSIAEALAQMKECDAWLDDNPDGFAAMPVDLSIEQLLLDAVSGAFTLCAAFGGRSALAVVINTRNVKEASRRRRLSPVGPLFIGLFAAGRPTFLEEHRRFNRANPDAQTPFRAANIGAGPAKEVAAFIDRHETVFVVEQNRDGQLRSLITIETGADQAKLESVRYYGGFPLSAHHVIAGIKARLEKAA